MEFEGSYFFTQELDDLRTAHPGVAPVSPPLREPSCEEGAPIEGETLPEDALREIRACLGF